MRYKNKEKLNSIFDATIDLVTKVGLSETSVSKIARKAGISSSTIYVYFESKEDLLISLYVKLKEKMMLKIYDGINENDNFKKSYKSALLNFINYIIDNPKVFLFVEQFNNSPFEKKIPKEEYSKIIYNHNKFYQRGQKEGYLKNIEINLLIIFTHYPAMQFVKEYFKGSEILNEQKLQHIINMSWEAVKK